MNRLGVEIIHSTSPAVRRGESVDLWIDGTRFVDLVGEIERPFASAEGHPDIAGSYQGLPAEICLAPSNHLLGEPNPEWTDELVAEHHPPRPAILRCDGCGMHQCWGLFAEIIVEGEIVIWRSFENPRRAGKRDQPWNWDEMGEFVFDRREYERALSLDH